MIPGCTEVHGENSLQRLDRGAGGKVDGNPKCRERPEPQNRIPAYESRV